MTEAEMLRVLTDRRDYLAKRIEFFLPLKVGCGSEHDQRELAALTWAIERLANPVPPTCVQSS
jgi:hypothetical protein